MRYRDHAGSTERSTKAANKHITRLGTIEYVRGYIYQGRFGKNAGVIVRGEKGTARFSGFSWGYNGTGPNGLCRFLKSLGVNEDHASRIAFQTPWETNTTKEAWRITFHKVAA